MRAALLVIGASRSGSSALAGAMGLLGGGLPKTLLGAGPGNERGHFEPRRLVEINDEILAAHGATYWDPVALPAAWFRSVEAAAFVRRIAGVIAEEYGDSELPIIKDPRLCRVAPLYLDALRELGYAGKAVIPLRHPGEAARSLSRRDGTPPDTAELLQIRELAGAEAFTRGLERAWAPFDQLFEDWRAALGGVASRLGFAWPVPMELAAPAMEAFLAHGPRRSVAPASAPAGPLAQRLWQAARAAAAGDEPAARAYFDQVHAVVSEMDRLSAGWHATMMDLAATGAQTREKARRRLARRQRRMRRLTLPVTTLDAWFKALKQPLPSFRQEH